VAVNGPAGFHNNYEFVVQISMFGLADNLAYHRCCCVVSIALSTILCIRRKGGKHEGDGRCFEGGVE
jgi:hypothetical protein